MNRRVTAEGLQLRSTLSIVLASAALSLAACGRSDSAHSVEWAEVNPDDVSPAALKAAVSDPASRKFYEARNWKAVWTDGLAQDLADTIHRAPEHALLANMFLPDATPDDPARREAELTKAALAFGLALAQGRVNPVEVFQVYTVPRPKVDMVAGLTKAIGDENVGEWLETQAPQTEEYQALSKAFLHYAQLASSGTEQPIAPGEPLKVGITDPRVGRLIDGLRENGYLAADYAQPEGDQLFAPQVEAAVKALQRD
jgi:murein L,D-transpeptidase YcbB/YkuD